MDERMRCTECLWSGRLGDAREVFFPYGGGDEFLCPECGGDLEDEE